MRRSMRGAVLVETLLLVSFLLVPLFLAHLAILREAEARLKAVESKRLRYDGVIRWRAGVNE